MDMISLFVQRQKVQSEKKINKQLTEQRKLQKLQQQFQIYQAMSAKDERP